MTNKNNTPLWQKNNITIDPHIMAFMAGDDITLDQELLPFDIQASKAHVQGLQHIDLLTIKESQALCDQLDHCLQQFNDGEFQLDQRFEDGHSAIEYFLTEKLGDLVKKVNTGRSRNDQVLVATRLWLKVQLQQLHSICTELANVFLQRASVDDQPMPGYTHIQRAVVSSTGLWSASFAESMLDNAQLIADAQHVIDSNPLGTAAGYGVNLPLDREYTTQALGFSRLQINPMYAQNSRGKLELHALNTLQQVLLDARRLAWDFSLFNSSEYDFIVLPDAYTTGSSIMPNKRNPDFVELLRAAPAVCIGAIQEIIQLLSLPSGYQRDLQNTKAPLIRAFKHGLAGLTLLPDLVRSFEWKSERLQAALEPAMLATDWAIDQAAAGTPFREAYQNIAVQLQQTSNIDMLQAAEQSIQVRRSQGACQNLMLGALQERLKALTTP